jgi:hypothetical protein
MNPFLETPPAIGEWRLSRSSSTTREIYLHAIPESSVVQWNASSALYLDPNGPKFKVRCMKRQRK